jgi:hypothetical protein
MERAIDHFTQLGFAVTDVSAPDCYDLDCRKGAERLRVEVKGTETAGDIIILTRNEVRMAREHHPNTAFPVVYGVQCDITDDGPRASGGTLRVIQPWKPTDSDLVPISYECSVRPIERGA